MNSFVQKSARRRANAGISQVELLTGIAIMIGVMAMVADAVPAAGRMHSVIGIHAALQTSARQEMDRITQDIQSSSAILASYTARNGTVFQSNLADTLVLSAPSYDINNNLLCGHTDCIIYHLAADPSNPGSQMLQETIDADPLSARSSLATQTQVQNLQSAQFTYLVHQATISNGLDLTVGLNAGVFGTGANLVQRVTVGGQPFIIGAAGQASLIGSGLNSTLGTLVFVKPPQKNVVIDLVYSVAPWLLPQNINVSEVMIDLTLNVDHPYLQPANSTTVDLTSSAVLRNH